MAESAGLVRRRGRSVRARTTAGAVIVVGVALIVASLALVLLLRQVLEGSVREAARARARETAVLIARGTAPGALPLFNEEDVLVQVVDGVGNVVAASPRLRGEQPIAQLGPRGSRIMEQVPSEPEDPVMVVAERAQPPVGAALLVLVGRNLDTVLESVSVVTSILLVAVPLLLFVVGATTWRVVGRSLAPVEAIRREVAAISTAELHRRVPTPPGDDEIARLATTMNEMLERLEESVARQQRFISDASHELRSPIAAIRHHAEVARSHPEGNTVHELADDVLGESIRLERLAEDLLLLARADEHTIELTGRPLDLDDLVLAEARRLRQVSMLRIDSTGVSAARTRGDRRLLERVVRNLADNAARHAASAVRLAVRAEAGRVVLEVDDDGPGVAPELRTAVFERFTRLDDARDRGRGGAGLGLAIVAEIVAAHGGSIEIGEAPLGGARFSVAMPVA